VRSGIDKTLAKDIRLPMAKSYFYQTYGVSEPGPNDELVNPATDNAAIGQDNQASLPPSPGNRAFSAFASDPSAGNRGFSAFGSASSAGNKAFSAFGSTPSAIMSTDMTASQSFLDGLTEEAVKEANILFMNLAKPIQDLVISAGSLEEIRDKVLETYEHMDADSLENIMAQVFTLARLVGVARGKDGTDSIVGRTAI
jgi:hypothetical protein